MMDPEANLKRQRELADRILNAGRQSDENDIIELAELVQQHLHYIAGVCELMSLVRHHSDYVFGTVFVREDFPDGVVPDDFNAGVIEDLLTERGNEYIYDHCGDVLDEGEPAHPDHRHNPAPFCAKCGGPCEMTEARR